MALQLKLIYKGPSTKNTLILQEPNIKVENINLKT